MKKGFTLIELLVVVAIIGILAALIIYLIFYAAGTSDTSATLLLKNPVSDGVVVTTTAGLYTVGVALLAGIVAIVVLNVLVIILESVETINQKFGLTFFYFEVFYRSQRCWGKAIVEKMDQN